MICKSAKDFRKGRTMCLIVLLTLLFVTASCQYDHIIYVDNHLGENNETCRTSNSREHACRTVQYALSDISNSTMVVLEDGTHPLDGIVNTTGLNSNVGWLDHIKIVGLSTSGACIECSTYNHSGAGLMFSSVRDLYIANITFSRCGSLLNSTMRDSNASVKDTVLQFRSAVYIVNCTDVQIESSVFTDGNGIGLVLYDTNGFVSITDSYFSGNMVPEDERVMYPGGGGIYIEHTYCTPGRLSDCDFQHNPFSNNSVYTIQNCQFHNNHATTLPDKVSTFVRQTKSESQRLGKGGAVAITLKGGSTYNNFTISNCNFTNNSAAFGGGLDIQFQDYVSHNSFVIANCCFQGNVAHNGAAATRVGLLWYGLCPCVSHNVIDYQNTDFIGNSAKWGGGIDFFSSRLSGEHQITNALKFTNCTWVENSAEIAAAVSLSPEAWSSLSDGYLPIPVFEDCRFIRNHIISGPPDSFLSSGILFITTFTVNFASSVVFSDNVGTAVYSNIARINVLEDAEVIFSENHGTRGGGLALIGFSSIQMFPNSTLTFRNNTATDVGGAVYAPSSDEIDFVFSRSCFIRYSDYTLTPDQWKTFLYFEGNTAARYGHSIYASSLLPCARSAQANGSKEVNVTNVFRWHPFHYSHPDKEYNIASEPANLTINAKSAQDIRFSPGQVFNLHPVAKDDLNQCVTSVYKASLSHIESSSTVQLDNIFEYVADGRVKIKGPIGSTFQLNLETTGTRKIGAETNVTLINCPPGYVMTSNSSTPGECVCSATTDNQQYDGITRCDVTKFKALLRKGFWIGCISTNDSNLTVVTGECPLGYCHYIGSADSFVLLPQTCHELDNFMCGLENRTGVLCGECQEGMSVYFHSQRYLCGNCSSEDSRKGWLFYILSELVPLTLLFAVVMVFSINLTSGLANSLIFFMQVLDFFEVNGLNTFTLPYVVGILTSIYRFFFGILNMDFLRFDVFSFCLWDGATVLDMLCFKYVTTACALALLSLLFLGAKVIRLPKCCCSQRNSLLKKNSIIDGVAAFIVISYAQCAKVSFQILTRVEVAGEGLVAKKSVIFLSGNVEYFGHRHLAYAIPAIFILLTLCTIPPIILIAYPAANTLFTTCQNTEERLTESIRDDYDDNSRWARITRCCKLDRLKPLLDSFQGCYKDRFRFFAGLYFVYRLAISAAFAFTTSAVQFYTCLEVVIITILAIHAIAQPYQRRYYNIVDALIFADLAVINGLSLYEYYWSQYASTHTLNLTIASSFQVFLIYILILYMAAIISLKIACKWKRIRYKLQKLNEYVPLFEGCEDYSELANEGGDRDNATEPFNEDHFPARLFETENNTPDSPGGSMRARNYGTSHTA